MFYYYILPLLLGMRHAYDVDHIVAIDVYVRKFYLTHKSSKWIGLFFAVGHSLVVIIINYAVYFSMSLFHINLHLDRVSSYKQIYFYIYSILLVVLSFTTIRVIIFLVGRINYVKSLESFKINDIKNIFAYKHYSNRFNFVRKPYMMCVVGFFYGLVLDTTGEILVLVHNINKSVLLYAPILFTVGMVLMDTIDSVLVYKVYTIIYQKLELLSSNIIDIIIARLKYMVTILSMLMFMMLFIFTSTVLDAINSHLITSDFIDTYIPYSIFGILTVCMCIFYIRIRFFSKNTY